MMPKRRQSRTSNWSLCTLITFIAACQISFAQSRKQLRYAVEDRAVVSIIGSCGPISLKPTVEHEVIAEFPDNPAVKVEGEQRGNRIDLHCQGSGPKHVTQGCSILLPRDSWIYVQSTGESVAATGLSGDITVQFGSATLEMSDLSGAHVHLKGLAGLISLKDIQNSQIEVHSAAANVRMRNVSRSMVEASSGSGSINYDGDPGWGSQFQLRTRSGALEISIPTNSPAVIKEYAVHGATDEILPGPKPGDRNDGEAFVGKQTTNPSRFELRSFSGAIHVKHVEQPRN